MIIGYARTSTIEQEAGLEAQQRDLVQAGCEKLFVEQVSSVDRSARQKLADALEFIREGDTLVVTKLDRLARSVAHLHELLNAIHAKGAYLRILAMNINTETPTGKLLLTIMGGVAEFEREIMFERQREGIAKAKAEGKYKGRKPTDRNIRTKALELVALEVPIKEVSKHLNVSRSTIYRMIKFTK
jgi:DNA invertase Pin-like site-specific DNA recombinase